MNRSSYRPRKNVAALLALLMAVTAVVANISSAYAATLTTASLSLSDPRPSATSQYTVQANGFTTGTNIGCIEVDLGTAVDGTGSIAGLDTSSATLVSQSVTATGTWTVSNTQSAAHKLRATNGTPVAPQSGSQSIVFGAVTNGSTANTSYFAVVKTYTDNTCATPVDSVTVQFIYTNGQAVTMAIDGSLTFGVASVSNSSQTVNGTNVTVTSTNTTLPFGTITAASNQVAAQDLSVATNAGNGYTVYIRYTGKPANGSGDMIADLAGATNAAPVSFSAAGTEAFGYTTEDATLGTGSANRFTGNKWAAFTTSNAEVAFNSAATVSETTRVGFQTGVSSTTKPGSYATTVVYTATPVY